MTRLRSLFQRQNKTMPADERLKKALHTLEVSIKAIMNALSERGVSDDAMLEFEVLMENHNYKRALDVATRYQANVFYEDEELVVLLVLSWKALAYYHERIWKIAGKKCERREGVPPVKREERKRVNELGEEACACYVGLIKMEKVQKRLALYNEWERRQEEKRQQEEGARNTEKTANECDNDEQRDAVEDESEGRENSDCDDERPS